MLVEPVKNTIINLQESDFNFARAPVEKPVSPENEPAKKNTPEAEILPSLLDQVQKNIKVMHNVDFQFSVHQATGRTMVKIMDQENGKLVREIPREQLLDLAAKIDEMIGIIFNKKV